MKPTYDLLGIGAIKTIEKTWEWNDCHYLERDFQLDSERLRRSEIAVSRYLLGWLREHGYLSTLPWAGYLTVESYSEDDFQVLRKQDAKPMFAFQMQRPPVER